jgi:hypothetical protein
VDTLKQNRVDAYVIDYTLLLNTLSQSTGDFRLAGAPFGAEDPYGIGLPKGSDGVAFVNAFLKKIEADGPGPSSGPSPSASGPATPTFPPRPRSSRQAFSPRRFLVKRRGSSFNSRESRCEN